MAAAKQMHGSQSATTLPPVVEGQGRGLRKSACSTSGQSSMSLEVMNTDPMGSKALAHHHAAPKIPWHLSTQSLTRRRKLSKSTGNLHGFMAEDYSGLNWPLPKMFGPEKYGYSLIDIEDPRYLEECSQMSQKLIRLNYDEQIIDLEWRKTYKALLDAEHRQSTLPANCQEKTKKMLAKEVQDVMTYLWELQEQRDMYKSATREVYDRCAAIKRSIKKETDLEELRQTMSRRTQDQKPEDDPFWRTKFNTKSGSYNRTSLDMQLWEMPDA